MVGKFGRPAGTMKGALETLCILQIEVLDNSGNPLSPPRIEFWVATTGTPPKLVEGPFEAFVDANSWRVAHIADNAPS